MENASKALVIAGAILVSILLISIGVLIINSTNRVTDTVGSSSDTMAVQSFNAQFTAYEGKDNTAAQIKELVSKVHASNAANAVTPAKATGTKDPEYVDKTKNPEKAVNVYWDGVSSSSLENTSTYTVNLDYNKGYVCQVRISKTTT